MRGKKRGFNESDIESWIPKTKIGELVKKGEIKNIDEVLSKGTGVREPEIVDTLLPNVSHELLLIGQAKGKFGGGQRRAYKQTQKKTAEGNKPKFSTMTVVGNKDGYVGVGMAGSRETVPARLRSLKDAKKNMIKISRGCGSWECGCGGQHSIPFKVRGKVGSVIIELLPAPKGVGLAVHPECRKILEYAGVKDVWSRTYGQTQTRINLVKACFEAMKELNKTRVSEEYRKLAGVVEGVQSE